MTITRRTFVARSAIALAAPALIGRAAFAQAAYPTQDLSWIVHQAPGGLIDTTTRVAQPHLAALGFKSTIDYVRGASGRIARSKLYRAKPDGYTIMTETIPDEAIGEIVYNGQYKVAEFQPVFGWYFNSFNLITPTASPIKTMDDLVKTAKSRRVTLATFGKGNASHLQAAMLKNIMKLNLQFVHFDGGAPAFAAVAGGHVDVAMGAGTTAARKDVLNFLGVFRDDRDPALPDTPTMKEQNITVPAMNQIVYANAGPGVPADRIAKLQEAFTKAFADPTHIEQQRKIQVFVEPMNAADLRKRAETAMAVVNEYKAELGES